MLQVVNLVEAPFPVLGKFKESFLELPKDLLTMVRLYRFDNNWCFGSSWCFLMQFSLMSEHLMLITCMQWFLLINLKIIKDQFSCFHKLSPWVCALSEIGQILSLVEKAWQIFSFQQNVLQLLWCWWKFISDYWIALLMLVSVVACTFV